MALSAAAATALASAVGAASLGPLVLPALAIPQTGAYTRPLFTST